MSRKSIVIVSRNRSVQKEQKLVQQAMPAVEMPQVDSSLPKGVLPADFFDDRVEGAVAMGEKRKDAEKRIQKWVFCVVCDG